MNDGSLIIKMMMDAWGAGDKARALFLHDKWMLEITQELKTEFRDFFGDDYEECFGEEERDPVQ